MICERNERDRKWKRKNNTKFSITAGSYYDPTVMPTARSKSNWHECVIAITTGFEQVVIEPLEYAILW